jgi:hypothetical protein
VSRQVADALSIDLHHHGFRIMGIVGLQHEESRAVVAMLPVDRRSADSHKCLLVVGLADNGELSGAVVFRPVVLSLTGVELLLTPRTRLSSPMEASLTQPSSPCWQSQICGPFNRHNQVAIGAESFPAIGRNPLIKRVFAFLVDLKKRRKKALGQHEV